MAFTKEFSFVHKRGFVLIHALIKQCKRILLNDNVSKFHNLFMTPFAYHLRKLISKIEIIHDSQYVAFSFSFLLIIGHFKNAQSFFTLSFRYQPFCKRNYKNIFYHFYRSKSTISWRSIRKKNIFEMC